MIESVLIILLISLIYLFYITNFKGLVYVTSHNNEKYLVQNRQDRQNAADIIHEIRSRILKLITILDHDDKLPFDKRYISNAKYKLETTVFRESIENSNHTSYSVNKGEEIVLCLRSRVTHDIHDINILMYVAVHELAHVICPEIGHTRLYNIIFQYILYVATIHDLYRYENYTQYNKEYCGIAISQNILNKSKE